MIGSLMSRLGDAEKLSIGQLQQAIQNGTIPAFVGVPLLQDKVKLAKAVQDAQAASNTQQMPIAQQVMAEAQGIEQAQSNLPIQGFAPGGIVGVDGDEYAGGGMVAFEDGGDVEEEDDDSSDAYGMSKEEEKIFAQLLSRPSAMNEEEAAGIAGLMSGQSGTGIRPEARAPRDLEDTSFIEKIKHLESRGRHTDDKGNILTSSKGAEGIMQVMPNTQRDPGFGVTPARDRSPAELERVGIDYANALLRKYGNEKLAAMAYNWGPGNVDKWIASGMKGEVPKETRQYAANFAQGGIAHFKDTGLVSDIYGLANRLNPSPSTWGSGIMDFLGLGKDNIVTALSDITKKGKEAKLARDLKVTSPTADQPTDFPQTVNEGQADIDAYNASVEKAAKDKQEADAAAALKADEDKKAAAELTKEDTDIADYRSWLKSYGEDIKKQKETDKYMALLAAGLGMMGGTSPHALTNVGQGGMKGVEAALAAQKATGAQERALMSGQLGLSRATLYDKMRRDALAQKSLSDKALAEYRQKQLELGGAKLKASQDLAYLKARKQFMDEGGDQKIQQKYIKKYGKDFMSDPVALRNYQLEINAGINELARINSADEIPSSSER